MLINYLPKWVDNNYVEIMWADYWKDRGYDWLGEDLDLIKKLRYGDSKIDTVRVFAPCYGNTDTRGSLCNDDGSVKTQHLLNLRDFIGKCGSVGLDVDLVLFGWRDSNQTGEDKYSIWNESKHSNYLISIYENTWDLTNIAIASLENEGNYEPKGYWLQGQPAINMIVDWTWRMCNLLRALMKTKQLKHKIKPWLIGFGISDVDPDWMNDFFKTVKWPDPKGGVIEGGCLRDLIDVGLVHCYNPGENALANGLYWIMVDMGFGKPIIVEELPSNDEAGLKYLLQTCETQRVPAGIWCLYHVQGSQHGIVELDGSFRYPNLFSKSGQT